MPDSVNPDPPSGTPGTPGNPENAGPAGSRGSLAPDDISKVLAGWPFQQGRINVRRVEGADGRPKMQIRLELGILQLELSGRPDGQRPEGAESLLEFQKGRLRDYVLKTGRAEGFVISEDECAALRDEAVQFYHRYVGLFVLEDYDGVIRDTKRNLEALDFCRDFAASEQDRSILEQFRPYIVMMRTRADASKSVAAGQVKAALAVIDAGLEEIRTAMEEIGTGDRFEEANEVVLLRGMRDMLVPKLPVSQRVELQERLKAALAAENYELAAILRDELKMLDD
jgi:hypothetical protein